MPIRVVVAHEHTLTRTGILAVLATDPQITVVAETADGQEAVSLCRRLRPALLILDLQLTRLSGLAAARLLAADPRPTPMLLVSATDDSEFAFTAIEAGVRGLVTTKATATDLLAAVHRVARGEYLLADAHDALHGTPGPLRPRERIILRQVADGRPNREIASQLGISERTVGNHLANIFTALGVHNRVAAVERARRHGWLPGDEQEPRTHAE